MAEIAGISHSTCPRVESWRSLPRSSFPVLLLSCRRSIVTIAAAKKRQGQGTSAPRGNGFGQKLERSGGSRESSDDLRMEIANVPSSVDRERTGAAEEHSSELESDRRKETARETPYALPSVSREQVLSVSIQSSFIIGAVAIVLQQLAIRDFISGDGIQYEQAHKLLSWQEHFLIPAESYAIVLLIAGGVTAARVALLELWPEFRHATNVSNSQALSPLQGNLDVTVVSVLPALTEELLFRGALIPAISPDWRGALIAGTVFGVLHIPGGRNLAFAAWASLVGCIYGFGFLSTGSVVVPILAHALSNEASALLWMNRNKQ